MAVYTVSQVSSHIKESLDSDPLLVDLWIVGEVSGLRASSAGHTYFSLKDRESLLRCVMFRGMKGAELLSEGDSVSVHGKITFYTKGGTTDFMVDLAMPEGVGELALELERLKQKLETEGLFEISRKRTIPGFPKRIGVVTSPSGAVLHDIQNVLQRRYPIVELVLSPTVVQGADAATKIAMALEDLDRNGSCDVIIIARGGGSLEDLWPFNEEVVARAIYACKTPVVSAIGHETDDTISDFVSDVRAPTPSAAAELVVPDARALSRQIENTFTRMFRVLIDQNSQRRSDLSAITRQMDLTLPDTQTMRRRVDDVARVAQSACFRYVSERKIEVKGLDSLLKTLDPFSTIKRGFAIVQLSESGKIVSSTSHIVEGDSLEISVADGSIPAVVARTTNINTTNEKRTSKRDVPGSRTNIETDPPRMAPLL